MKGILNQTNVVVCRDQTAERMTIKKMKMLQELTEGEMLCDAPQTWVTFCSLN